MVDIIGEAGVASVRTYLDAAYNGKTQEYERELTYKDGKTRMLHVKYIPDIDATGYCERDHGIDR